MRGNKAIKKMLCFFKGNRQHIFYISAIALVSFIFVFINSYIQADKMVGTGDIVSFQRPIKELSKKSILEYGQFPHWILSYFGGTPFWANAQNTVFSFPILFSILSPTVALGMNLVLLFNLLFAGIFTYFLVISLNLKPRFALFASFIYMFNGYSILMARSGGGDRWDVYVWLPFIMLFLTKSFVSETNWTSYSIIAGIGLAGAFHAGDPSFFLPIVLYAAAFVVFQTLFNFKKLKKNIFIAFIVFFILASFSAIKVMPLLEYSKVSNKASGGFSYKESVGGHIEIESLRDVAKLVKIYVNPHSRDPHAREGVAPEDPFLTYPVNIGYAAFILFLLSLFRIKNKNALFYWLMVLLLFLIGTGSPFYYLLWKFVPGFSMQHNVERLLVFLALPSAVLAAFGASFLYKKISGYITKKYLNALFFVFALIILIELGVFMKISNPERPYADVEKEWKSNQLLQDLSDEEGVFRITNFNTNMIGGYTMANAIFNNLQILYGFNNVWIPEYFNVYLGVAHSAPEKFYGMLNTKYIYSDNPLNRTNLKFIKKFEECEICKEDYLVDQGIDGPYLYENKLFLPRAYVVPNSILVVGDEDPAKQAMYGLMLDEGFNPSNTVIVMGESGLVDNYGIDFLKKFDVIFLTQGSVGQNSYIILKQYNDMGGILIPDIINGKNTVTNEDINQIWASFKGNYKEINISYFSPNKIILDLDKESGFMVLSDKFFMFEGWKAKIKEKGLEILRANGINSAVYLENEKGELVFYYSSKSFKTGAGISLLTLMIILAYLAYIIFKQYKKNEAQHNNSSL